MMGGGIHYIEIFFIPILQKPYLPKQRTKGVEDPGGRYQSRTVWKKQSVSVQSRLFEQITGTCVKGYL